MDNDPILPGRPAASHEIALALRILRRDQFDALAERETILREAHQEAERIRLAAEAEKAQIVQAANEQAAKIREDAESEGVRQGFAAFSDTTEKVNQEVKRIVAEQNQLVVKLARTLAVRVLKEELAATPEKLGNILREVLTENLPEQCRVIRVHPAQYDVVVKAIEKWGRRVSDFRIEPDRKVALTDLRLEYRFGIVDARIETLVANGAAAILGSRRK